MAAAGTRVERLLALVPYLVARPGVAVDEVATVFGVPERQLRADLDLLFMCGLPGYTPGDLIDVSYEGDRIWVSNAETIARPLQLTVPEGLALLVAARTLAREPGLIERDALDRALAKLEAACAAGAGDLAARVDVEIDPAGSVLTLVEHALATGRRLHLRYHTAGRDDVTERDVDPMRVFTAGGRWYLEGYCRRVDDVRRFRLDRVLDVAELPVPADVPPTAEPRDIDEGLFVPAPDDPWMDLELSAAARWVADYYPCEVLGEVAGGGLRVRLRATDEPWLRRLALRLAGRANVTDPDELVSAVRTEARAALSAYTGPD